MAAFTIKNAKRVLFTPVTPYFHYICWNWTTFSAGISIQDYWSWPACSQWQERWNKCPLRMPTTLFTPQLKLAHDPLPCRSFGPAFALMNVAPQGSNPGKCFAAAPCKLHCLTISSLTIIASNFGIIQTVNNFWGLSEKEQCEEW